MRIGVPAAHKVVRLRILVFWEDPELRRGVAARPCNGRRRERASQNTKRLRLKLFVRSGYVNRYAYMGPDGYVFRRALDTLGQDGDHWTPTIVENSGGASVHRFRFASKVYPFDSVTYNYGEHRHTGFSLRCLAS